MRSERRAALLDPAELADTRGFSHLVIRTPASSPPSQVNIDTFPASEREIVHQLPTWTLALLGHTLVDRTSPGVTSDLCTLLLTSLLQELCTTASGWRVWRRRGSSTASA